MGNQVGSRRESVKRLPNQLIYPVAVIRWVDAQGQGREVTKDNLPKPLLVDSIGAIVDEGEDFVCLAQDIFWPSKDGEEVEFRASMAIPRGMIVSTAKVGECKWTK